MDFGSLTIIIQILIIMAVFGIFVAVGTFIYKKLKSNSSLMSNRLLNPLEYLPEEEVLTLRQVYFLIMIIVFAVLVLYLIIFGEAETFHTIITIDVIVSLFLAIQLEKKSLKDWIILLLLVPYGSLAFMLNLNNYIVLLNFFHALIFIYFIKIYFSKFMEYTESNGLGITIMLLFAIVFVSFFVTIFVEGVSPLDAIVMVSNSFTSNGYAVLGHSAVGKVNSIILVWSGFILSGAGTATLAAAIVIRHIDKDLDDLEELIRKNKE